MFKTVWSQERYHEEYRLFCKSQGEPEHTSMTASISWHAKAQEKFNKSLHDKGIGWEKNTNDDYKKLRNSNNFRAFLETQPNSITLGDFHSLARKVIEETFGDLSYLDVGYPKLQTGTIERKKSLFLMVLIDYGIMIDEY